MSAECLKVLHQFDTASLGVDHMAMAQQQIGRFFTRPDDAPVTRMTWGRLAVSRRCSCEVKSERWVDGLNRRRHMFQERAQ